MDIDELPKSPLIALGLMSIISFSQIYGNFKNSLENNPTTSLEHKIVSTSRYETPKYKTPDRSYRNNFYSYWDIQAKLVSESKKYIGTPYVTGGEDLIREGGFDCSGFVQFLYKNVAGTKIPRVSRDQFEYGRAIKKSELTLGDLVFFNTIRNNNRRIDHVGMYIGNGEFIHASSSKKRVTTAQLDSRYWTSRYEGARRIIK